MTAALRGSLGLSTGTIFSVRREDGTIVLEPIAASKSKARIVKESGSRFSVLTASGNIPKLTGGRVKEILSDFP